MMSETLSTFALAWGAFAVAALSPGPNMLAVASRSLGTGRLSGQFVALGIAIGAFVWAMFAVIGLDQVFAQFPKLPTVLGTVGGAYLIYLGSKGLRSALNHNGTTVGAAMTASRAEDLRHGLLVTLTNPKVGLLWISLSLLVTSAANTAGSKLLFAGGAALLAYLIYGGYGIFFSSGIARSAFHRFSRIADAAFGITFCAFGVGLIWTLM